MAEAAAGERDEAARGAPIVDESAVTCVRGAHPSAHESDGFAATIAAVGDARPAVTSDVAISDPPRAGTTGPTHLVSLSTDAGLDDRGPRYVSAGSSVSSFRARRPSRCTRPSAHRRTRRPKT